jgi:hypothetical protein
MVSLAGLVSDVNIVQVGSNAVHTGGLNGLLGVGGTQAADTAAKDASFPVQVGQVIRDVLTAITDGRTENFLADTRGRTHIRAASFDDLTQSDRVAVQNTIASDRTETPMVWADETDLAVATHYFPSSAGHEIQGREHLSFAVEMRDGTLTVEAMSDNGSWGDISESIYDLVAGADSFASWVEGDVATVTYMLEVNQKRLGFQYVRLVFVPGDATNIFEAYTMARKP